MQSGSVNLVCLSDLYGAYFYSHIYWKYRRDLTPDGPEERRLGWLLHMKKCGSGTDLSILIFSSLPSSSYLPSLPSLIWADRAAKSQRLTDSSSLPTDSVLCSLLPPLSGCRLHGSGGCRGSQEAGADQGRETRTQLHDGHAAHQEGV